MKDRASLTYMISSLLMAFSLLLPIRAGAVYQGGYPYKAVTTTGMVADVVKNVAGNRAAVTNIIGSGVDPHLYSPTRDDVSRLMKADVVFYSGLLLEGRMTDVLMKVGRTKPVYAVTELIDEKYLLEIYGGHHDPHVWMDVRGWMKATEAVIGALAEFDPANAAAYRANGAAYLETLKGLDDYARAAFASVPKERRVMITAHDAFQYMGRAYDIEVHGIQGISTESEAGLKDINRLVDMIVARRIPAVFVESSVPEKNVRALVEGAKSRGQNVKVGGSLFSDAMGAPGTYEGTYVGMIDHNVTTIVRALGGKADGFRMAKANGDKKAEKAGE